MPLDIEKRQAYLIAYRKATVEQRKISKAKYRIKNKEFIREANLKYKNEHKEEAKKYNRIWLKNHPRYNQKAKDAYDKKYPERLIASRAEWRKKNKSKISSLGRERQAAKLNATPQWRNTFFIDEIYHLSEVRTKATGIKHHVDHIVPIKSKFVCGLHNEFNLQVIPWRDNIVKGNRVWPNQEWQKRAQQCCTY